ncbi:MAG: 2-oxo acid dehydrogenase subunit E2 [Sandaracinaceae bacterium]|nr:2-oxo acid dehydrogenase subunit E2 [Sandaracinaceae bacterium]
MQKPGDEIVPFTRRRRIIAEHMVYSKLTSPHVVTFAETDIHKTSVLRDRHKGRPAQGGHQPHLPRLRRRRDGARAPRAPRAQRARAGERVRAHPRDQPPGSRWRRRRASWSPWCATRTS